VTDETLPFDLHSITIIVMFNRKAKTDTVCTAYQILHRDKYRDGLGQETRPIPGQILYVQHIRYYTGTDTGTDWDKKPGPFLDRYCMYSISDITQGQIPGRTGTRNQAHSCPVLIGQVSYVQHIRHKGAM
jgi:hypothetical protein